MFVNKKYLVYLYCICIFYIILYLKYYINFDMCFIFLYNFDIFIFILFFLSCSYYFSYHIHIHIIFFIVFISYNRVVSDNINLIRKTFNCHFWACSKAFLLLLKKVIFSSFQFRHGMHHILMIYWANIIFIVISRELVTPNFLKTVWYVSYILVKIKF